MHGGGRMAKHITKFFACFSAIIFLQRNRRKGCSSLQRARERSFAMLRKCLPTALRQIGGAFPRPGCRNDRDLADTPAKTGVR